jgi:transcription elongation factor Elf1
MGELDSCPVCQSKASMRHTHDEDGCYWAHIECNKCGLRTRGSWCSTRSDACSIFYAEVRDAWNARITPTQAEGADSTMGGQDDGS